MNELNDIKDYFLSQTIYLNWYDFLLKLFLSTVASSIIAFAYFKYSSKLNVQKKYFYHIIIISIIVTTIIAIIKGSLALSLGMVGALSIVRFRTAIKDPAELIAFFSAIAVGITVGADQPLIAFIFAAFLLLFSFVFKKIYTRQSQLETEILVINLKGTNMSIDQTLASIHLILQKEVLIKSLDVRNNEMEFVIELGSITPEQLNAIKNSLEALSPEYSLKFISTPV